MSDTVSVDRRSVIKGKNHVRVWIDPAKLAEPAGGMEPSIDELGKAQPLPSGDAGPSNASTYSRMRADSDDRQLVRLRSVRSEDPPCSRRPILNIRFPHMLTVCVGKWAIPITGGLLPLGGRAVRPLSISAAEWRATDGRQQARSVAVELNPGLIAASTVQQTDHPTNPFDHPLS
ncbi:hypothetical protein GCM10011581_17500 [Saccharopolyspora subtropica]|uniref:Uncharacterized protein n=1 Tax=Saccharopolyspora thermophila TaxID=89367 RepID=A0A917JQ30_9PSEU|nr:hypothetical protein GCM10011581_17500 [Saccharopolyspora subtropica]